MKRNRNIIFYILLISVLGYFGVYHRFKHSNWSCYFHINSKLKCFYFLNFLICYHYYKFILFIIYWDTPEFWPCAITKLSLIIIINSWWSAAKILNCHIFQLIRNRPSILGFSLHLNIALSFEHIYIYV